MRFLLNESITTSWPGDSGSQQLALSKQKKSSCWVLESNANFKIDWGKNVLLGVGNDGWAKIQSEIYEVQLPCKVSEMISHRKAMHSNAASLHKGWTSLFQQWVFIFSTLAPRCVTLCSSLGPQRFTPHLLLYTPLLLPLFGQSFYFFFLVFRPLLPTLPFVLFYYMWSPCFNSWWTHNIAGCSHCWHPQTYNAQWQLSGML